MRDKVGGTVTRPRAMKVAMIPSVNSTVHFREAGD